MQRDDCGLGFAIRTDRVLVQQFVSVFRGPVPFAGAGRSNRSDSHEEFRYWRRLRDQNYELPVYGFVRAGFSEGGRSAGEMDGDAHRTHASERSWKRAHVFGYACRFG